MSEVLRYKCKIIKIPDPNQPVSFGGKIIFVDKKECVLQQLINRKWVDVPEVFDD